MVSAYLQMAETSPERVHLRHRRPRNRRRPRRPRPRRGARVPSSMRPQRLIAGADARLPRLPHRHQRGRCRGGRLLAERRDRPGPERRRTVARQPPATAKPRPGADRHASRAGSAHGIAPAAHGHGTRRTGHRSDAGTETATMSARNEPRRPKTAPVPQAAPGTASAGRIRRRPPSTSRPSAQQLLGKWADTRRASRDLAGRPNCTSIEGLTHGGAPRPRPSASCSTWWRTAPSTAPSRPAGGSDDHGGNVAGFQELVIADPSLQIKAGVQWGLFGSAVTAPRHRGTPREVAAGHHEPGHPRLLRHDRDRARLGRRQHRHHRHLRPARPRSSWCTPRSAAAWKDYIGNAAAGRPGRRRLRPAGHPGRQPRRPRVLRGPPRPRDQGLPAGHRRRGRRRQGRPERHRQRPAALHATSASRAPTC